jgi:hypothetical protein
MLRAWRHGLVLGLRGADQASAAPKAEQRAPRQGGLEKGPPPGKWPGFRIIHGNLLCYLLMSDLNMNREDTLLG